MQHEEGNPEGWQRSGETISRRFGFETYAQALVFVQQVSVLAEEANHHPDVRFGWGYAVFSLTTHDKGALTVKDITLAQAINRLGHKG